MRVIFLGTNGWYDTKIGNTISVLIETDDFYIILDAGNGLYKLNSYLNDKNKKIYLFLSHFHLDHIIGLHTLDKLKINQKLNICGPKSSKKILKKIINVPFTKELKKLNFKNEIYELPKNIKKIPFNFRCLPLLHTTLTLGYRFEIDDKVVTYCTDTGICPNLIELAKNSDLFILECSFKSKECDEEWPHLNPENTSKIAVEANVKKLALFHFDASRYKSKKDKKEAGIIARKIFKNTIITEDDMEIYI